MVKELKQGILFTLVTMGLLGGVYNVLLWGVGRTLFPFADGREPHSPRRRHGGGLPADRAEVHAARVLPARGRRAWTTTPRPPAAPTTGRRTRIT